MTPTDDLNQPVRPAKLRTLFQAAGERIHPRDIAAVRKGTLDKADGGFKLINRSDLLLVAVLLLLCLGGNLIFMGPAALVVLALIAVGYIAARYALTHGVEATSRPKHFPLFLAHGVCTCGYDLVSLPADTESRTVRCPECGAAWWPGRFTRAAQSPHGTLEPLLYRIPFGSTPVTDSLGVPVMLPSMQFWRWAPNTPDVHRLLRPVITNARRNAALYVGTCVAAFLGFGVLITQAQQATPLLAFVGITLGVLALVGVLNARKPDKHWTTRFAAANLSPITGKPLRPYPSSPSTPLGICEATGTLWHTPPPSNASTPKQLTAPPASPPESRQTMRRPPRPPPAPANTHLPSGPWTS